MSDDPDDNSSQTNEDGSTKATSVFAELVKTRVLNPHVSDEEERRNPLHLRWQSEIIGSYARVAELADALDLGSSVFGRAGSSPVSRNLN